MQKKLQMTTSKKNIVNQNCPLKQKLAGGQELKMKKMRAIH